MKKAQKVFALVLAACLLLSLTSCGKSVDSTIKKVNESADKATSFDMSYTFDCLGAIGNDTVTLTGRYSWMQSADNDLYEDIYNTAKIGDSWSSESLKMYCIDGTYYYEKDDNTYTCSEAILSPAQVPGQKFWPILAAAEKTADDDNMTCSVILTGEQLKTTMKELCYNIYSEVAPFAQWDQMSAEFTVKLNEAGYLENMQISAPDFGKALISLVGDGDVTCSDFDVTVMFGYYEVEPLTPDNMGSAQSAKAMESYGMAALIKDMVSANNEQQEIDAENEAAANFTAADLKLGDSVTLSCNGKNLKFTVPSDIKTYSSATQQSPTMVMIHHAIMESVAGSTKIEIGRATVESYFGDVYNQTKEVSANGISGRLYTVEEQSENYFGKTVVEKSIYFAADLGDGETILAIFVNPTFDISKGNLMDESMVQKLLDCCSIIQ